MCRIFRTCLLAVVGILFPFSSGISSAAEPTLRLDENGTDNSLPPRFYLAGLVGASFATATASGRQLSGVASPGTSIPFFDVTASGNANDTLLTGGGAIGVAMPRPHGALRLEIEGRARETLAGNMDFTFQPIAGSFPLTAAGTIRAEDGWSALVNLWRDVTVAERLSMYAGGGFGAGGYRSEMTATTVTQIPITALSGTSAVSTFAWQAGGGAIVALSDRVVLDVGYRFFALGTGETDLNWRVSSLPTTAGSFNSAFAASELLFSLRIYEPFRGW